MMYKMVVDAMGSRKAKCKFSRAVQRKEIAMQGRESAGGCCFVHAEMQ